MTSHERVVVVADAHVLGPGTDKSDAALLDFLAAVPAMADRLIINGDLFDFWFEYRSVIPRRAIPWLHAISAVRNAGVDVVLTGGNHDRWGGSFWPEQMRVRFEKTGFEGSVAGHRTLVHHGDGLSEQRLRGAVFHKLTRNPVTIGLFRLIHPDVGFWLVEKLYGAVRENDNSGPAYRQIERSQVEYAKQLLEQRAELDLVILSHVHTAALVAAGPKRWFLNPGPWLGQMRYALVTEAGPKLCVWGEVDEGNS